MRDIIFLAHRVPFPPDRGDRIRSAHILRHLASLGRVHVGCLAETDREARSEGARELASIAASHHVGRRRAPLALSGAQAVLLGKPVSLTAFHSRTLAAWVEETCAAHPDAPIVVFSGQMGQYVPEAFKGRVILDLCDVDSAKFESYAASGERVWLNRREARLLAAEEERLARRAQATILISENEASLFRSRLARPDAVDVRVIGNGIDASVFDPETIAPHPALKSESGPHFVFTGQMDYRPNETAAIWAIEHFLPAISARFSGARLHIVGRNPTAALVQLGNRPGVRVWGEVPDVRPFLAGATCVIAPLLIARGVQNKVLEAMAMARPVLLSAGAANGIGASDGEHWLIEPADADAMADRFAKMRTAQSGPSIGAAARRFVVRNHTWQARLAPFDELLSPSDEARNAA